VPAAPSYRERLTVPWSWWLTAPGLTAVFAAELFLGQPGWQTYVPYVVLLPAVLLGLWWLGRIEIRVTDEEFQVDDARLPLSVISEVTVLDRLAKGDLLGPLAEPYAFVIQRPWVAGAVKVTLDDSVDPTPYWMISTRRPSQLAAEIRNRSPAAPRSS
jgi:hypothetical protein